MKLHVAWNVIGLICINETTFHFENNHYIVVSIKIWRHDKFFDLVCDDF